MEEKIIHQVDIADSYATQHDRGVAIFRRGEREPIIILKPPAEWGCLGLESL